MSNTSDKQAPPLMSVVSGGMTLTMLTMIFFGCILLGIQIWIFTWPKEAWPNSVWGIAPGIIGLTWILLYLWFASRKGRIDIFADRLEGKRTNGKPFALKLAEVQAPNLLNRNLVLKDSNGKIRFLERLKDPHAAGLVWMLKTYADFPLEMLQSQAPSNGKPGLRIYLDENGEHQALDNGQIFDLGTVQYYFPDTQPLPIPNQSPEQSRIYLRNANPYLSLPQFEPSPALLPLAWWLDRLVAAPLELDEKENWLNKLAEEHGGCAFSADNFPFEVDFAGRKVEIRNVEA